MILNGSEYAGFWIRVGASLVDTLLLIMIIWPLLTVIYGSNYWLSGQMVVGFWDLLLNWVFPAVAIIVFWIAKSATPGKMATRLTIVDAKTGEKPSNGQFVLRYFGYILSSLPLLLGFLWVAWDDRKQGFHDKIAGTVVLRNRQPVPVNFDR